MELGLHAEVRQVEAAHDQSLVPVPPPISAPDLAERAAALLEDASAVGELEAVLAYLATGRADEALEPLRKRAKAVVARGPRTDSGDAWLPGQVARLLLDVLGDPVSPADPDHPEEVGARGRTGGRARRVHGAP